MLVMQYYKVQIEVCVCTHGVNFTVGRVKGQPSVQITLDPFSPNSLKVL